MALQNRTFRSDLSIDKDSDTIAWSDRVKAERRSDQDDVSRNKCPPIFGKVTAKPVERSVRATGYRPQFARSNQMTIDPDA